MANWFNQQIAKYYLKKATRKIHANKLEEAIALYQKAKSLIPTNDLIEWNLAICYDRLKKHPQAIQILESLLKSAYLSKINVKSLLASSYAKNQQLEDANELFLELLNFDAYDAEIWNNYGYNYLLEIGKYKEAINAFDKAIELNKNFAYAYNNRGFAKIKINELDDAFIDIQKSIELAPTNSYSYKNRAKYYIATGEKEKAIKDLKKAKKMNYESTYDDEVNRLLKEIK